MWWTLVFHDRQAFTHTENCCCCQKGNQKIKGTKLHFFWFFCIIPTANPRCVGAVTSRTPLSIYLSIYLYQLQKCFLGEKSTVYTHVCVCVCMCVCVRERERERVHSRMCVYVESNQNFSLSSVTKIFVYCTISNITCSLNSHHNSLKWNCDFLFNLSVLKKAKINKRHCKMLLLQIH